MTHLCYIHLLLEKLQVLYNFITAVTMVRVGWMKTDIPAAVAETKKDNVFNNK